MCLQNQHIITFHVSSIPRIMTGFLYDAALVHLIISPTELSLWHSKTSDCNQCNLFSYCAHLSPCTFWISVSLSLLPWKQTSTKAKYQTHIIHKRALFEIRGTGSQLVAHVLILNDSSEQVYVLCRHPAFNPHYISFSVHLFIICETSVECRLLVTLHISDTTRLSSPPASKHQGNSEGFSVSRHRNTGAN